MKIINSNDTWEIGSGDIMVEAKFQNHGEPAYSVTAEFFLFAGIRLRSILPICRKEYSQNVPVVTCDVGNPFPKGSQVMTYFQTN